MVVNTDKLEYYLNRTKYNESETQFLVNGFRHGFSIGYQGPLNRQSTSRNIPFTPGVGDAREMWSKIMEEVSHKRVAGPFRHITYDNFIQSPVGLVPKHGNKTRLIFHLSYDFPGESGDGSLNYYTPRSICTVHYKDIDYAVRCCLKLRSNLANTNRGRPTDRRPRPIYFSKTDIRSAFRLLPVLEDHWPWLIFKATNPNTNETRYFVDKCLPFGASISCALFQCFSDALRHIIVTISGKPLAVTNYLDDFLFMDTSEEKCNNLVRNFLNICHDLCVPIAHDKTEWASPQIIFLGILLNGIHMVLSVPLNKRQKAIAMINQLLEKKKATVKQLQQLAGYLNFLSKAIHPGCAFTRCIYSKYSNNAFGAKNKQILRPHHHVRLDSEFKLDCEVWRSFLSQEDASVVCRSMMDLTEHLTANQIDFWTDASATKHLGFGGVFGKHWLFGRWPPGFIETYKPSIAYLELFALVISVLAWDHKIKNAWVILYCDNQGTVEMVNNTTSKCKHCMVLIRLLVLSGLNSNRRVYAKYLKSHDNGRADALSRLKLSTFFRLSAQGTDERPTALPEILWPIDKLWNKT